MRNVLLALVLVMSALATPGSVGATEEGSANTGAIWGTVSDAITGRGVNDVCVWVAKDGQETTYSGYTNHDGVYEIGGMLPGTYELQFNDCELGRYDAKTVAATVVAANATQSNASLSLAAGIGGIRGHVVDATDGAPLVELCVKLYHANDDIYVTHAYTASDGSYQLLAEAGEYRVRFKPCEGDRYIEQWYDGAEGWDGSAVVTITAGSYVSEIDAALTENSAADSVIWGYVVDGTTGDQVDGYCVSLYVGDAKINTVLTGSEGGWEMVVSPDAYHLKAWACEGHEDLGTVWYLDGADFESADVIDVPAGVETQVDTIVVGDVRFRDALESLFHADIVWLAERGITLGCNTEGTEFCPQNEVTRAQMAAFLHRALGELLEEKHEVHFDDVVDGSTFDEDIRWLASVGVTFGCNADGTEFCPEEVVSRGQMAAFLHRALKDILVGGEASDFDDDDGSAFEADIEWLASVGVTGGCDAEGTQFCPDDAVIRSHMAAFLHRALGEA